MSRIRKTYCGNGIQTWSHEVTCILCVLFFITIISLWLWFFSERPVFTLGLRKPAILTLPHRHSVMAPVLPPVMSGFCSHGWGIASIGTVSTVWRKQADHWGCMECVRMPRAPGHQAGWETPVMNPEGWSCHPAFIHIYSSGEQFCTKWYLLLQTCLLHNSNSLHFLCVKRAKWNGHSHTVRC